MERLIETIKSDFETEVVANDKRLIQLRKLNGELFNLTQQTSLFDRTKKELADWNKKITNLTSQISHLEQELAEIKSNKIYENAFEWRFEFPEVLNDEGDFVGFDVVIGNPPYIKIQDLGDLSNVYKSLYFSARTGNYDIYVLFIEKSIHLIKSNASINFILPHKFLVSEFGKGIRNILYQQRLLSDLVDFGHSMVFEDATTYTCLLTLRKGDNSGINYIKTNPPSLLSNTSCTRILYTDFSIDSTWVFTSRNSLSIIAKINQQSDKFENVLDKIFSGIQTSADKIYTIVGVEEDGYVIGISRSSDQPVKIEKELVKKLIKGEDIKRYACLKTNTFIIFPYSFEKSGVVPMEEKFLEVNYPEGYKYLKLHEHELRGRENGKMDVNSRWFLYNYPKNLFLSNQRKLVSPDITYKLNVTKDWSNYCVKNGAYGITIKPQYIQYENEILALLNSTLLWFFLKETGSVLRGGYFRFNTKYILPFSIPSLQKLSETDCATIVDLILSRKQSDLLADTKRLESEIDRIVYELYGLTEEEIGIVEGQG